MQPQRPPVGAALLETYADLLLAFGLGGLLGSLVSSLFGLRLDEPRGAILALVVCLQLGFLAVVFWRMRMGRYDFLKNMFGTIQAMPRGIASGIGWGFLLFTVNYLLSILGRVSQTQSQTGQSVWNQLAGESPLSIVAAFAIGAILAPVAEEMFFRGLLFGRLKAVGLPWLGMVLSATLFALAHMEPGSMIILFAFGMVFVWLYVRTGTLVAPIIAHATNNALGLMMLFG